MTRAAWAWILLTVVALAATGCARRAYVRPVVTGGVSVYAAPPPPPQVTVQRPVQPYAGAIWVDGHWEWDGAQYVWVPGYWEQSRVGYTFVQPRWQPQGSGYVYYGGGWTRGGRVVHPVSPAPYRSEIYVRPGAATVTARGDGYVVHQQPSATVQVQQPSATVQVQRPAPVYVQRPAPVYVQQPGASVTVRGGASVAPPPSGRVEVHAPGGSATIRAR